MNFYKNYDHIIAHSERSAGNETVGAMWTETKSFDRFTPVHEIIEWAKNTNGKLFLTIDERTATDEDLPF